jgi:DNA-binding NtrC family response regulator
MKESALQILLVEDNLAEARLFMETLKDAGGGRFELTHVDSLRKARESILRFRFDALLLDLSLPDSYGLDTLIEIQQTAADLPILILTGNEDETVAMKAVQMGAEDFLFKGDMHGQLLIRSIRYAIQRKKNEAERERLIRELQAAVAEVKSLSGLLPICASCKSIRDDQGYWQVLEKYMAEHAAVQFSHGICPVCARKLYPDMFKDKDE